MSQPQSSRVRVLLYTVYFIYFFCGMTLCFEGAFNPEFKDYFQLSYQQQMYTMFAKNIPFVLAIAIGFLVKRIGFKNCLSVAMLLFAAGTLLLIPGLSSGQYWLVLVAFFVIGTGFNFELVAGNPLLSGLGAPAGGASRLNLGNALGAIAQIIAPLVLTLIIPVSVVSVQDKLPYMKGLFVVIGGILIGIAAITFAARSVDISAGLQAAAAKSDGPARRTWLEPRVLLGFVTIFLVLGAEAGVFGLYRNYLEDPDIAGLSSHQSQRMFTLYFATFALGRLAGSWAQKRVKPATTLTVNAVAALLLLAPVILARGAVAVAAITALGFFVSIFFPTLYALAIEGMGEQTAQASGLLTMGFLGCAILPVLQGRLADSVGLQPAFVLCLVPYLSALLYSLRGRRMIRMEIPQLNR
jgi:FHS family L-fucose permease-like MFS transporter